jgi:spermidine/putrescine transport system ATP-binding protein
VSSERGSVVLRDVTKRYGTVAAVDGLSLDVRAGEFLSLLGPSGCGKTTTLRMLAGFEQPDAGEINISGTPVAGVPPYKRDVNTVFQHYSLFPHMSVAENVAYGLRQKGVPKSDMSRQVSEALGMVKMTKLADRRPRQMSGGQQQRVALARALVNRPSVLLLDEPLGALDRKLRQEMQVELKLLQREVGITFIFVTHDQEEALSMSDRIAIMLDGHVEQLTDPDTIYEQPASAFVAAFIGQNNFWRATTSNGTATTADGIAFSGARHVGTVPAAGDALVSIRPESISLTQAFGDSTGANAVVGTLAGVAHLGDVLQYVVRTPGNDVIVRLPRHQAPSLPIDERVICSWTPGAAYVYSADQASHVLSQAATPDGE